MVDVYTGIDGLTYTYDNQLNKLTITGNGAITALSAGKLRVDSQTTISFTETIAFCEIGGEGSNITSIGYEAFYGCTNLRSITVSDTVTSIEIRAFAHCSLLSTIRSPLSEVVSIGQAAFTESALSSIVIGDKISSIGQGAFFGCDQLTLIEIGAVPASIGSSAFNLSISAASAVTCVVYSPNNIANGAFDAYKGNYTTLIYRALGEYIGTDGLTYSFHDRGLTITGNGASSSLYTGLLTTDHDSTVDMRDMVTCHYGPDISSIRDSSLDNCTTLSSISVDENNVYYSSADGVLFNKDKTSLIKCPAMKAGAYTIPATVTTISANAFYSCPDLTSVTIPSTVTAIPYRAFLGCTSLSNVSIPNTVTSIGGYAFSGCISLQSVVLPDGTITSLGNGVFSGCTSLTSINIPRSVTTFGEGIFERCSSLVSVSLPYGMSYIPDTTFDKCSSLVSITIPNTVVSIGDAAFMDCVALTSLNIPDTVTTIGSGAFYGCSGIRTLTISLENNITGVTNNTGTSFIWEGCTNIQTVIITKATASAYDYTYENYQFLPWYISRNKFKTLTFVSGCVKVPDCTFLGCTALETINLPNTLTTIGNQSFDGCTAVRSWTIPIDVVIHYGVSTPLSALETINFLAGTTGVGVDYGASPFSGTTSSFKNVTFRQGISKIGSYLLDGKSSLNVSLELQSVETIGTAAFRGCSSIPQVSFGSNIQSIGNEAFKGCTSMRLTSSLGSTSLTSIGSYAFEGCANLKEDLEIPVNVTTLKDHAFANCTSIKTVSMERIQLRSNQTDLPEGCFAGCTALESVTLTANYSGSVTVTGWQVHIEMFMGCTSLGSIPSLGGNYNIRTYKARCFKGCTALSALSFNTPATAVIIEESAFEGCTGVTTITFLSTFASIGSNAFKGCGSVGMITFEKDIGSGMIASGAFTLGLDANNQVYAVVRSYNFWAQTTLEDTNIKGEYTHFTYLPLVDYFIGEDDGLKYTLSSDGTLTVTNETGTPVEMESFHYGILYAETNQRIDFGNALKNLVIGADITGVSDNALMHVAGVTNLQTVSYTDSIFEIGASAFEVCYKLRSVKALTPNSQVTIGTNAFNLCGALNDVNEIGDYTTIEAGTFSGCSALEEITFPVSLSTINRGAFTDCTSLTAFHVDENNAHYSASEGVLYDKSGESLIQYPPGLQNAYYTIPEGVVTIGVGAFEKNTILESIVFPTTLRAVMSYAFNECYNINSFYFNGSTPVTFASQAFSMGTAAHNAVVTVRSYDDWADYALDPYANQYTTFVYVTTGYVIQFISTEGVELSETRKTHTDGILDEFPEMPARTSELIFLGWSDTQSYEVWTPVTAPHKFTENTTLYAKWRDIPFAYSMVFVLAPGTVNVADINDCWKVRPIADDQTTIGSWREISDGVYRWGYDPPEGEAEDNLAITLITPTDAQIDAPDGMRRIRPEGPRWYSLAPYVPIDDVEVSETLVRRGGDHIFTAVFYPNWEPARLPTGARALIMAPGMQALDFGEIQGVTKTYTASNTVLPIVCYGFKRSFVMDLGTSTNVSLKYIRVQPKGSITVGGATYSLPWDGSSDSRHWSNAKWGEYLRAYMDRWQMRTNGQQLFILNPGNANGDPSERYPDNAICEIDGANCYIASAPISYGSDGPDVLSGSVQFELGTLYPKKETPVMRAVTFALGGDYASHWGETETRTYVYPEGGIIILPEYFWDLSVSEIDVSGGGATYSISGWLINGELRFPGDMVYMDEIEDQDEIVIYADTSEYVISGDTYYKTNGDEAYPFQEFSIAGEFTVTIDDGLDDAYVNVILVGGGGGGAGAKTVRYMNKTLAPSGSRHSLLMTGGGGGASGQYKSRISDAAWKITRTPENNGTVSYKFILGRGGSGGIGATNVYEESTVSTSGGKGTASTLSVVQGDTESQLMIADGGAGGRNPGYYSDSSTSYYQSTGGTGGSYSGGSGGKASVLEEKSNYFTGDVERGYDGAGAWNAGAGMISNSAQSSVQGLSFIRAYASGSGGGAGLPQDASGLFTNPKTGDGGQTLVSSSADDDQYVRGMNASHGCGGGGGGTRLNVTTDPVHPTENPVMRCGAGGVGGRGFIIVYTIGAKITSRRTYRA